MRGELESRWVVTGLEECRVSEGGVGVTMGCYWAGGVLGE